MSWSGQKARSVPALLHETDKYRAIFINNSIKFECAGKDGLGHKTWLGLETTPELCDNGSTKGIFDLMLDMRNELEEQNTLIKKYENELGIVSTERVRF